MTLLGRQQFYVLFCMGPLDLELTICTRRNGHLEHVLPMSTWTDHSSLQAHGTLRRAIALARRPTYDAMYDFTFV